MKIITLIVATILLAGCSKTKFSFVSGTMMQAGGCGPNAWIVLIDNPDADRQSFLCPATVALLASSSFNCGNSAIILDVPVSLQQTGKKVYFSKWQDKGLSCLSWTYAPHAIEVSDLRDR